MASVPQGRAPLTLWRPARPHATQIDPDGPWFAVPRRIQQSAWPTEDFELVHSTVPTRLPEDDLFAGLRPTTSRIR